MNVLRAQASLKNVMNSLENVCEVEDLHLSMSVESDDHRVDVKGLDDDSSKPLLKNSRHGTINRDSNTEDKLSVKSAAYSKNDSLIVAPMLSKPMPDSILVQKSVQSANRGHRNNFMNKSGKTCKGPMGASSKLHRNSIVSLVGGSTLKTGQSNFERLVHKKKENHQRRALSDKDTRSVRESKCGNQLSPSVMQKSIPAALAKETSQIRSNGPCLPRKSGKKENHQRGGLSDKDTGSVGVSKCGNQQSQSVMLKSIPAALVEETSQIRSNVPCLPRKSGIPMPSRVATSSLKARSQIPTCMKRGR